MIDCIEAFKAIGEPTRFRALHLLVEAKAELCACEIIDVLEKPQYTISKALGALVDAGLVTERRDGRKMLYELAHSPMNNAIFKAVSEAPLDLDTKGDLKRLQKRLGRREKGECISGCG